MRSSTTQVETASERGRGQPHLAHGRLRQRQYEQHEEHGRIFERPSAATPGTDTRPCEVHVAPNGVSELFSLAFRRRPIDELRRLCPLEEFAAFITAICCRSWSRSRDVERFHRGIWTEHLALCASEASCASPTAGDGRWGSRERERGGSRRWYRPTVSSTTAHVDRHRLVVEHAAALDQAGHRALDPWGCRSRWRSSACARRSGSTAVKRTSCACRPRWRRRTGDVMRCQRRRVRWDGPHHSLRGLSVGSTRTQAASTCRCIQYCHPRRRGEPEMRL